MQVPPLTARYPADQGGASTGLDVRILAQGMSGNAFENISWREESNERMLGPFAALTVRCTGSNAGEARLLPQQWLPIEWPAGKAWPEKYYLSALPETAALNDLVRAAHMRWRTGLARVSPPRQSEHCSLRLLDGIEAEDWQQCPR